MRLVSNKMINKVSEKILSIVLLCLAQDLLLKPATGYHVLQDSYLVELGTEFSLRCPHLSKKLPLEWTMEGPLHPNKQIGATETLTFPIVEFNFSGKYTCNETRVTNEGFRFVLHETNVLVIESRCLKEGDNSSKTTRCQVKYFNEDRNSIQIHRLCEPLQKAGAPLHVDPQVVGQFVSFEVPVEKENEDCVFMITYLNSSVRLWPPSNEEACYQLLSQTTEPNVLGFTGIVFLVLQLVAITMLVSIIYSLLKTYASNKKRNSAAYPACGTFTSGGYEELREGNLKYSTNYITPV